jgi:hypothetical protein
MMGRRDIGVGFISGFSISSPRAGWQALGEEMSSPSAFPLALGDFFCFFPYFLGNPTLFEISCSNLG